MTSTEIQQVSELIAFHPPIAIGCVCIFMYIRSRFLQSKSQEVALAKRSLLKAEKITTLYILFHGTFQDITFWFVWRKSNFLGLCNCFLAYLYV